MAHHSAGWTLTMVVVAVAACGSDTPRAQAVPAAAFERAAPADRAAKNYDAMRRRAIEQSERDAKLEEARIISAIESVTIVPPKRPRQLAQACDDVAEAMDGLVERQFTDDGAGLTEWSRERTSTLDQVRRECRARDSIDVAACQAHAMQNAPDELVGAAFDLISRCRVKYGTPPPEVGRLGS